LNWQECGAFNETQSENLRVGGFSQKAAEAQGAKTRRREFGAD